MSAAVALCLKGLKRSFLVKPKSAYTQEEESSHGLKRNMSLFDLICVGVGGTVGTGVFVLSGFIAKNYSGPSAMFSFLVAGAACFLSAASYGELSSRIPAAGSSYAYVYAALGEYPAVIAAFALSLEYGISGSAVARSWGDKMSEWISSLGGNAPSALDGNSINLYAGFIQFTCVVILLAGVNFGKFTINGLTVFKVILVMFMIFGGFSQFNLRNLQPLSPEGFGGIMRGATSCFFGFIGFDEVCCMAAEASNAHVVLPRAVFGTIWIVTILYCFAAFSLVGMQYYKDISETSCFSDAFRSRNLEWAAQIVSVGELICLPLVVLVSFLAQPRLQYAMAIDGLLPSIFSELDNNGNLFKGIVICGITCTVIALFVPFTYLDDMISAGVLFSFNLTNTSLIMIRYSQLEKYVRTGGFQLCSKLLLVYHALAIALSVCIAKILLADSNHINAVSTAAIIFLGFGCLTVGVCMNLFLSESRDPEKATQFRVPCMPVPPLLGIIVNYVLIFQLTGIGLILILAYFGLATMYYYLYCVYTNNSVSLRHHESNLLIINDEAGDDMFNNRLNSSSSGSGSQLPQSRNTFSAKSTDQISPIWNGEKY